MNFLGSSRVLEIIDTEECSNVCLDSGATIKADFIVLATGLVADQRIAISAGLSFENGILIDPHSLETSQKHIYALGDCISFNGQPSRYVEPINKQAKVIECCNRAGGSVRAQGPGSQGKNAAAAYFNPGEERARRALGYPLPTTKAFS